MRKILFSLLTIGLVVTGVAASTRAVFSDTETSTGNTFTAGTLNLTVNDEEGENVIHVERENMIPHENWTYQGYNQQFNLKNTGSVAGKVTWKITNIENFENECLSPEVDDVTCGLGDDQGELGEYTWVRWSRNQAPWGYFGPQFNPLNTAEDVVIEGPTLAPGETLAAYMWLDFPIREDNLENLAQGDTLKFDIEFNLTQE